MSERDFAKLVDEVEPTLRRYLASRGIPVADLDDLVQECFFALVRRDDIENPQAFLMGTAKNLAKLCWRRRSRRPEESPGTVDIELSVEPAQHRWACKEDVRRGMQDLPDRYGEVLTLRLELGMTSREIAEKRNKGETPKSIASVSLRAIARLKKYFVDEDEDEDDDGSIPM